jgi:Ca-activated chloride channel homolog
LKVHLPILVVVLLFVTWEVSAQKRVEFSRAKEIGEVSIHTRIVSLTVTVSDESGRHLSGLNREAFKVYEDGVVQMITHFSDMDQPASISIIFDISSSMEGKKFDRAANALKRFIEVTHRDDLFSLVVFNDQAYLLLDSTNDAEEMFSKVTGILPQGNTALYDGVALGLQQVISGKRSKQALVVITDGHDNHSRLSARGLRRIVEEAGVPIYTILIKDYLIDRSGKTLIEKLSEITGGRSYSPSRDQEIGEAFEQIALELRHQYSIGYEPANFNADGKWRRLKTEVVPPPGTRRLIVRNRKGYFAVDQ